MNDDQMPGKCSSGSAPQLLPLDSPARRILREKSVVMGGIRALLMQAVHPAVASAIERSSAYHKDPWGRHARTLHLMFIMFLAEPAEALAAIRLINRAHRTASGVDPDTGWNYPANDPDLLLWVHASLVTSFLHFERLTMGALDDTDRQRVHQDLIGVATLLGLPRQRIPATPHALECYVADTARAGVLRATDSSRKLQNVIMRDAPLMRRLRLRPAVFLGLHTLPEPIRSLYGIEHTGRDERRLRRISRLAREGRRLLPQAVLILNPRLTPPVAGDPQPASDQ